MPLIMGRMHSVGCVSKACQYVAEARMRQDQSHTGQLRKLICADDLLKLRWEPMEAMNDTDISIHSCGFILK